MIKDTNINKLSPNWRTVCLGPDYVKYMCLDCGITIYTKVYDNGNIINDWTQTCPICGSEDLHKEQDNRG